MSTVRRSTDSPAEVDQQAQRLACRPHCGTSPVAQRADDHVVIKHDEPPLLDDAKPALSHLVGKRVLIDLFSKPMTERIGGPESTLMIRSFIGPNNRASLFIPLIRLEKPALPSAPKPDRG